MNWENVKEVFVNNIPRNKNLLQFIQRCYYLREIPKIQLLQENCYTSGVVLGKCIVLYHGVSK